MTEKINRNHTFISAGTKVKLSNREEYGIVVHSWYDKEMDCVDCHVAFFGNSFPDNQTKCKPYILRYLVTSLETVE